MGSFFFALNSFWPDSNRHLNLQTAFLRIEKPRVLTGLNHKLTLKLYKGYIKKMKYIANVQKYYIFLKSSDNNCNPEMLSGASSFLFNDLSLLYLNNCVIAK